MYIHTTQLYADQLHAEGCSAISVRVSTMSVKEGLWCGSWVWHWEMSEASAGGHWGGLHGERGTEGVAHIVHIRDLYNQPSQFSRLGTRVSYSFCVWLLFVFFACGLLGLGSLLFFLYDSLSYVVCYTLVLSRSYRVEYNLGHPWDRKLLSWFTRGVLAKGVRTVKCVLWGV